MSGELTTGFVARTMRERGYQVYAGAERAVRDGVADSRRVEPGDLFTGFHGAHTDGNVYLEAALERGAVAEATPRRELYMSHVIMAAIQSGLRVEGLHLPGAHYLDIGVPENLVQALRTQLDSL